MKNSNHKPVISIVIPVYNTEKYLEKCLTSIVKQTYRCLEIIVVNDASPGNVKDIVDKFSKLDKRFKYVEHKKNKGLFHARVTGSELATGDYIAFVDSDDHVSVDYYRLLVNKAIKEKADIVEGRIIRENEDGNKFIQNNNNILEQCIEGNEIKDKFFSQEGLFYHWHVIWNKLYTKELWDKCLPYYKEQNQHLIMTEDLAFSSVLFCNAQKYCSTEYDGYFYYIRSEAATGAKSDLNKFTKNFKDMGVAFNFVEDYLKRTDNHKYIKNIMNWKKGYFRLWASRVKNTYVNKNDRQKVIDLLMKHLKIDKIEYAEPKDTYHCIINTPWEERYEKLKKDICKEEIEYVSFDIFDTLVLRPFVNPRDLLIILDQYFHEIYFNAELFRFSDIRLEAENKKRELVSRENPLYEDINLDEIYNYIGEEYDIPLKILEKLKAKEIELEIQFSSRRNSIYEIYRMALEIGKKVIFISDMYLSCKTVSEIVKGCGYKDYNKIYVSSNTRLLKNTGNMYEYVLKDLKIEPNKIMHIGDNWNSDKINAEKKGLNAFFVPKTTDLLMNKLEDKETGNSIKFFNNFNPNRWIKYESNNYFSTSCMLGIVANKIFDNPYATFNSQSDFNIDPYFIGYYALGMHILGLTKWIMDDAIKKDYNKINFIARDGHLPFRAFNILKKVYKNSPESNYIYASRKSLLPYVIQGMNRYNLTSFLAIEAHTPDSILRLFEMVIDKESHKRLREAGININKNFESKYEFNKFIDYMVDNCIDIVKLNEYNKNVKEYISKNIKDNEANFDLGYSARLQTIIVNILEKKCDTYFVHTNGETPWKYSKNNNFEINTFYSYKPSISGILREHMFAELTSSCIGYTKKNGYIEPVFEQYYSNSINTMMVNKIQNACIDFCNDFTAIFGDYMNLINIKKEDVSNPLEMYIHSSKKCDRSIFMHSYSDDEVHGGNPKNNILNWWNNEIVRENTNVNNDKQIVTYANQEYYFLNDRSKFIKFVFYYLFDRDKLKIKVKKTLNSRPKLLKTLVVSYGTLRNFKRIIIG